MKNAAVFPLMLPEGLIVHEKIDGLPVAVVRVGPSGEFRRGQRPSLPTALREAERNVVGEAVIFKKHFYFFTAGGAIQKVRTAPAEYMVPSLRHDTLISVRFSPCRKVVAVREFGIPQYLGRYAE